MSKLKVIKEEFTKYMAIKDKWIVDVVLGNIVGNSFIPRDPIWTMIVAPSSGGKSTYLSPCSAISIVHFLDDMTEKTFLSGFKSKGQEMSLLKMIGSGVLVFSDFTSILSKNPMSSAEILGQLRLVYDGTFIKQTGVGKIEWKGKMGVLAASTPDVYHKLEEARSMGERFGYYIMEQPNDEEIALKQEEVNMSSKDISLAMQPFYREYFVGIKAFKEKHGVLPLTMTTEQKRRLRKATQLSVLGKATVHLNKKSGKVDQIPNKAGVGRDNKMAEASLHAFQLMDAYENDNPALPLQDERIELIEKMTYSSLSRERRKVLEILAHAYTDISASKIGTERGLGLDKDSVELYLTPLHAVGLIKKVVAGSMHTWRIADKATKEFVLRVSAGLDDDIPQSTDEEDIKNDLADQIKAQIEDQWEKEF